MDMNVLEPIPGTRRRFFQFTTIDDCTRIRVLKGPGRTNPVRTAHGQDESCSVTGVMSRFKGVVRQRRRLISA